MARIVPPHWLRRSRHAGIAFAAYLLLTVVYTWPLLAEAQTRIPNDPFDPMLNTSILWWNATVVPFTTAWWTPPFFFPAHDIAAFTENLAGIGVVSTPLFWITRDPVLTYNLTFFLTWPLSALAAYLLAWRLLHRHDAAFIAGLAFGFAPYRLTQLGHLQVLSIYWLPLALLGLHGYLADRRRRWLGLFGAAWILQSLSNGYFMFFGGVVIAMWIAYFCSSGPHRRSLAPIVTTWAVASAPLAAVMLKYRDVHQQFGLSRGLDAAIAFGAQPRAWLSVADLNWFWSRRLPDAGAEFNLFPGATALALVVMAGAMFLARRRPGAATVGARALQWVFGLVAATSLLAIAVTLTIGPWRRTLFGLSLRMSDIERAAPIALIAVLLFVWLTPALWRRLRARSPFAFYGAVTIVAAILACGPEIRGGSHVLLTWAPYRWLMAVVPGMEGIRVSARFWAMGTLCLGIAAASAFAWLTPPKGLIRASAVGLVCAGLMLDAWPRVMPMAPAPGPWPIVEPPGGSAALIELPLGPRWDAAATFRSLHHRRRVVNGVSGYDPPHYQPLQVGLEARDPSVLLALATFGPLEVVVNGDEDPGGSLTRYVRGIPGVSELGRDGSRIRYQLPDTPPPVFGAPLPHRGVTANAPSEWFVVDLEADRMIGGIELSIGRDLMAFPRRLAIDVSTDAVTWRVMWDGSPLGAIVRGAALNPTDVRIDLPVDPVRARFVRLRQTGVVAGLWSVGEVRVFAPVLASR